MLAYRGRGMIDNARTDIQILNQEKRENLIISNRPIVYWLAQKFKVDEATTHELIVIGMDTLLREAEIYKKENGDFSAYVYNKIRNNMITVLANNAAASVCLTTNIEAPSGSIDWVIEKEQALALTPKEETAIIENYLRKPRRHRIISQIMIYIKNFLIGSQTVEGQRIE